MHARGGPKGLEFLLFLGRGKAKQENAVIIGNVREATV